MHCCSNPVICLSQGLSHACLTLARLSCQKLLPYVLPNTNKHTHTHSVWMLHVLLHVCVVATCTSFLRVILSHMLVSKIKSVIRCCYVLSFDMTGCIHTPTASLGSNRPLPPRGQLASEGTDNHFIYIVAPVSGIHEQIVYDDGHSLHGSNNDEGRSEALWIAEFREPIGIWTHTALSG